MQQDFLRAPLAKLGTPVCRIGLSATYRPGRRTVFTALDEGINYYMYFGLDTQITKVLCETMHGRRDQFVLATGGCNWILFHRPLRQTLERRLRQMRTDYIDIFHYFGITRRKHFTQQSCRPSGKAAWCAASRFPRTTAHSPPSSRGMESWTPS